MGLGIWNAERVEALKGMWAEGLSAGLIANRMNCGLSRNAVISKVRRLGLPFRAKTTLRYKRSQKNLVQPRTGQARSEKEQKLVDALRAKALAEFNKAMTAKEEPGTTGITILSRDDCGRLIANDQLDEHCCRWPIGDPGEADFHFCGARRVMGLSYCAAHVARAYIPTPPLPSLPVPKYIPSPTVGGWAVPVPALEADQEISDMQGQRPPSPSRVLEAPVTTH